MSNNTSKWKKEIAEYDKKIRNEEFRNKKVLRKLKKIQGNVGHSDGADNQGEYYSPYSINSLSGDPTLERELKQWREALKEFRKIGD